MIRGSSKLILPTVNTAVAAVLLTVGYTRPPARVGAGTVGIALCFTVNAPANLLRYLVSFLWDKHIYVHCSVANARACWVIGNAAEIGFFLIATFLAWYVVAPESGSRGQGKRAIVPSAPAERIAVDVVLLVATGFLAFLLAMNWKTREGAFSPLPGAFGMFCCFAWAVAMAISYGYDFIKVVARTR